MSHVYDFHVEAATQVPWGRGNGWGAVFPYRSCWNICLRTIKTEAVSWNSLQAFVRDTWPCREAEDCGIRVLTPGTYEEASCTAMFIYGFSRAVRFGWIEDALGKNSWHRP